MGCDALEKARVALLHPHTISHRLHSILARVSAGGLRARQFSGMPPHADAICAPDKGGIGSMRDHPRRFG
jgi:hypothetical protein